MPFNLSGSTITQTGTDTDLSGLSGIAGVTVIDLGVRTIYVSPHRIVNSSGSSLSWDNQTEELAFTPSAPRDNVGGTLRVDGTVQIGNFSVTGAYGNSASGIGVGLTLPKAGGDIRSWVTNDAAIYVSSGATFNAYGCDIQTIGSIFFDDGSFGGLRDCFVSDRVDESYRLLNYSSETQFINNKFIGFGLFLFNNPNTFLGNEISGTFIVAYGPEINGGFDNFETKLEVRDLLTSVAGDPAVRIIDAPEVKIINPDQGVNTKIAGWDSDLGASRNRHYTSIVKEIDLTAIDASGNGVEGAKLFIRDTDNGQRDNIAPFDDTANKEYQATSDSTGGFGVIPVTTLIFNNADGSKGFGVPPSFDYRTKGNGLNTIDVFAVAYDKLLTLIPDYDVSGIGVGVSAITLVDNTSIVESNKTTVDAYSELETPQKFYDRAKAYLVDNYAGETQTIVTRVGDEINAGSYDIVIDATASSVFDLTGNTITIKAATFTGNITTTGTVTLLNGAIVNGGIIDSNGDSFLSFTNEWEVYTTESDRNTSTNPLGTGTSSQIFRFTFSANTTYYMWVAGTKQQVTPTQSGETSVDLSTSALLSNINDNLGYVNRVVYCDIRLSINGTGTNISKFNSIDDAINEFNMGGYDYIDLKTDISTPATPSVSLQGVKIIGTNPTAHLFINNLDCSAAEFDDLLIQGQQGPSTIQATLNHCKIIGDFSGLFVNAENDCQILSLTGQNVTLTFVSSSALLDINVTNIGETFLSCPNGASLAVRNITGKFTLQNVGAGSIVSIDSISGDMTLDSSCTGGNIRVHDTIKIVDNSLGSVVVLEDLPTLQQIEASTVLSKVTDYPDLVDQIQDGLAKTTELNTLETNLVSHIDTNETKIDQVISNISSLPQNNDLSISDKEDIAVRVESHLLDEGDGQMLINAIVSSIGSVNIDQVALVAAIRADLERNGGMLESLPLLSEIEGSSILAKTSDITGLNDISVNDVWTNAVRTITGGQIDVNNDKTNYALNESSIHSNLDSYTNKDNWKTDISSLSTFDPLTDLVSLNQATFDERMLNVPETTKNTYKGSGSGSGLNESELHTALDNYPNKDLFSGVITVYTNNASESDISYSIPNVSGIETIEVLNGQQTAIIFNDDAIKALGKTMSDVEFTQFYLKENLQDTDEEAKVSKQAVVNLGQNTFEVSLSVSDFENLEIEEKYYVILGVQFQGESTLKEINKRGLRIKILQDGIRKTTLS